ncbi:MAG: hypothetical protein IPP82_16945 [Xanthomonadales bacterium]|nr:hypothetical protein [Xanthomonadales bacterium]
MFGVPGLQHLADGDQIAFLPDREHEGRARKKLVEIGAEKNPFKECGDAFGVASTLALDQGDPLRGDFREAHASLAEHAFDEIFTTVSLWRRPFIKARLIEQSLRYATVRGVIKAGIEKADDRFDDARIEVSVVANAKHREHPDHADHAACERRNHDELIGRGLEQVPGQRSARWHDQQQPEPDPSSDFFSLDLE